MMTRQLHADALKPSPPAILNRATPESMTGIGIIPVGKWNAVQSTIPPASGASDRENNINRGMPPPIATVASHENSVQSAVYFREQDFDDEVDLDFEVEDPRTKGSVSQQSQGASTTVTIEAVTNQAAAVEEVQPNSSAPLSWSSSPVHHRHGPPSRATTTVSHPPSVAASVNESRVDSVEESDPPQKKRRTLFWDSKNAAVNGNGKRAGQAVEMAVGQGKSGDTNEASTGVSNVKTEAKVQPWEQTPGAVKESQKRLKQERKRATSSLGSREASVDNSLLRKPKRMERVFLSDEQKWVEKLVVTEGRSVFFTGSAG